LRAGVSAGFCGGDGDRAFPAHRFHLLDLGRNGDGICPGRSAVVSDLICCHSVEPGFARKTFNVQRPTPNAQRPMNAAKIAWTFGNRSPRIGRWALDVGRWTLRMPRLLSRGEAPYSPRHASALR